MAEVKAIKTHQYLRVSYLPKNEPLTGDSGDAWRETGADDRMAPKHAALRSIFQIRTEAATRSAPDLNQSTATSGPYVNGQDMRLPIFIFAIACLGGCGNDARQPITFSCVSSDETTGAPGETVHFHFAEGFLFLQNDEGAAQNVCNRQGTVACSVKATKQALILQQSVEEPYCGFRPVAKTELNIDRESGTFRLLQEGCDPKQDILITGRCQSVSK